MSKDDIEISRRKILGGLGAVGLASAGAGMGTAALFSDEESFENNSIVAGELDLKVDWEEHYSFPQLYGFDDPTDGLDVTRSEPTNTSTYVGLPDPDDPVVWVPEDNIDAYMSNTAIEAFPDPDNDGEQEVEGFSEFQTDDSYSPCEDGADLPDDLDVGGLRTDNAHTDPEDNGGSPPLIQLQDVKPGDFGEFTFSFHLCDNPGYVWLQAANFSESEGTDTEPEGEVDTDSTPDLAENIKTIWWYDARGDNVPPRNNCEGELYLTDSGPDGTDLFEVILNNGRAELNKVLNMPSPDFDQVDAIAATPDGKTLHAIDKDSGELGAVDISSVTPTFSTVGPLSGTNVGGFPGGTVMAAYSPAGVLYMASSATDGLYTVDTSAQTFTSVATINKSLSGTDIAFAADGTLYLISTESSNNKALYTVDPSDGSVTKKGTGTGEQFTGLAVQDAGTGNLVGSATSDDSVYVIERDGDLGTQFPMEVPDGSGGFEDYNYDFGDMTASHICGEVFHQGTLKQDLGRLTQDPPVPLDGNRATPFDEFAPGNTGADSNRECFQPSMTHYIGFGWWVPEDVGNEIQGDSVNFDLGFYTQQCRNNDGTYEG